MQTHIDITTKELHLKIPKEYTGVKLNPQSIKIHLNSPMTGFCQHIGIDLANGKDETVIRPTNK